jgi:uncharacterized membrane protein YkoI
MVVFGWVGALGCLLALRLALFVLAARAGDFDAAFVGEAQNHPADAEEMLRETVQLGDVPEPARETIELQRGDGRLDQIEMTIDAGQVFYDVDITTKDGRQQTFSVTADGTLHAQLQLDEVPELARSAIRERAVGATIDQIDKTTDGGQVFYDVDITAPGGKQETFSVSPDGSTHQAVELAELPDAARNAVEQQATGATIVQVDKMAEGGRLFYDVEITRDGRRENFSVAPDGSLYDLAEAAQPAAPVAPSLARRIVVWFGIAVLVLAGVWLGIRARQRGPPA